MMMITSDGKLSEEGGVKVRRRDCHYCDLTVTMQDSATVDKQVTSPTVLEDVGPIIDWEGVRATLEAATIKPDHDRKRQSGLGVGCIDIKKETVF